jgi:DNA-binding CsgD family transcriptional regulator
MNENAVLSKRESEIAEWLAWGAAKKEIADKLSISTRTVENTTRNVYAKIGIQKVSELCVWWFTTHCGVSMNLSPFKRKAGALLLLLLMLTTTVSAAGVNMARYGRCQARVTRTTRAARRGSDDIDFDFDYINL